MNRFLVRLAKIPQQRLLDDGRKLDERRGDEDLWQLELDPERRAQPRNELRRANRVAAQREEVVGPADRRHAKQLAPKIG